MLLELYAATLLLRATVAAVDQSGRFRGKVDHLFGLAMRSPFAPLLLGVPVVIAFVAGPRWFMWFGIRTPDFSLVTNAQACAGYGTAFVVGWLLHQQIGLLQVLQRRWALNLVLESS